MCIPPKPKVYFLPHTILFADRIRLEDIREDICDLQRKDCSISFDQQ